MDLDNLSGEWTIDPAHTRIGFSSRHAMVSRIRGAFNDVSGHASIDASDLSRSTVSITVRMASVDTRQADRDAHLRSADFFDVENHPTMTFTSTTIDEVDEDSFAVTGDLEIRGVSRSVTVPLSLVGIGTDPGGVVRAAFEGSRRIDRKDWGVSWNTALDAGGLLVSDKISLEFELSLIKQTVPAAEEQSATEGAAPDAEDAAPAAAPIEAEESSAEAAPSEGSDVQSAGEQEDPSAGSVTGGESAPEAESVSDAGTSANEGSSSVSNGDAPKLYDSPSNGQGDSAADSPARPSNPPKSFASAFKLSRR